MWNHSRLMEGQAEKQQASFASVYSLDAWGKPAASAKLVDTGDPLVVAFEMEKGGATAQIVVAHRPGAWTALGWKSDARVLVARRKGNETQVLVAGGTAASSEAAGGEIRLDEPGTRFGTLRK